MFFGKARLKTQLAVGAVLMMSARSRWRQIC